MNTTVGRTASRGSTRLILLLWAALAVLSPASRSQEIVASSSPVVPLAAGPPVDSRQLLRAGELTTRDSPALSAAPTMALGGVLHPRLDPQANDNAPAIQAAMDVLVAQGGGVIQVPPGTFLVSKIIQPSNTTIRGAGRGVTVLRLIDNAPPGSHVIVSEGTQNIGLSHLTIDGNRSAQTAGFIHGCRYNATKGLRILDVEFRECVGNGCVIQNGSTEYVVDSSWAHDNGAGGFYEQRTTAANSQSRYVACVSERNGWGGFNSFSCDYVLYDSCIARANVQDQTSFPSGVGEFGSDSGRRMTYVNCVSSDSLGGGFNLYSNVDPGPPAAAETVQYVGCKVYNAQEFGFLLRNCIDASIVGCTVSASGLEGNGSVDAIIVQSTLVNGVPSLPARNILISGCIITRNGRSGIHLQGAENVTIAGCIIMNNSTVVSSQHGIRIDQNAGSAWLQSSRIQIRGNRIGDDREAKQQARAIMFMNGSHDIHVSDNDLGGNQLLDPIGYASFSGRALRFHDNAGMPIPTQASAFVLDPSPQLDTIEITGTTDITALGTSHAYPGRRIRLRFTHSIPPSLVHGNNIRLNRGAAFTPSSPHEIIELETDGTVYREISRSANG